jgi:hypothetical protein
MKKSRFYLKKVVYFVIISVLGIAAFMGVPTAYFIIGIWSALTSFALYKDKFFMMRILHADFRIEEHKNKAISKRLLEARFSLFFSMVMFVIGLLVYIFPDLFWE